jgi:hypothetical protein
MAANVVVCPYHFKNRFHTAVAAGDVFQIVVRKFAFCGSVVPWIEHIAASFLFPIAVRLEPVALGNAPLIDRCYFPVVCDVVPSLLPENGVHAANYLVEVVIGQLYCFVLFFV